MSPCTHSPARSRACQPPLPLLPWSPSPSQLRLELPHPLPACPPPSPAGASLPLRPCSLQLCRLSSLLQAALPALPSPVALSLSEGGFCSPSVSCVCLPLAVQQSPAPSPRANPPGVLIAPREPALLSSSAAPLGSAPTCPHPHGAPSSPPSPSHLILLKFVFHHSHCESSFAA